MLSYRRETALQDALVLAKSGRLELGDNIFFGHYRSICNHCDIIGLQSYRIWVKIAKQGCYAVQGYRGRYQSKSRMRLHKFILVINTN